MKKVNVKLNEENPEPLEIIAESIINISKSIETMKNSRLGMNAIMLLIHDNCEYQKGYPRKKPTMKEIKIVLDSIDSLSRTYVKQPAKK